MIIPYDPCEEKIFIDIIQEINNRGFLTYKESLFVLFFTFDILTYFGELNNISHEQQQLIQFADDEYYKNPLTIEREVVLRRLVKQYQQKNIPDAYKGLLHDKHRIILNRVISQSRK